MSPVHYHEGRFPPSSIEWPPLIPLLGPASAAVARYDGMLAAIPNSSVLLSPLTTQEAVLSSRIEGTQATIGEVLEFEAGKEAPSPERRDEIREILNYRIALRGAQEALKKLPLSQRVIREAHRVLLSGVRGQGRAPGEYRTVQNWIGPPGRAIDQAIFVPIAAQSLPDAMGAWEKYLHSRQPDTLVQLAVLHAEFESLHPFLDGNGRIGRMLVPLFLWHIGLIRRPVFYVSAYFEARRDLYYEKLLSVSRDDDWTGWCEFFLEAVRAQAEDNIVKARAIYDLYEAMKPRVAELTHSQYAIRALDWLFERPIFRTTDFFQTSGIPRPTAKRFIAVLTREGILSTIAPRSGRRASVLGLLELLRVTNGRD